MTAEEIVKRLRESHKWFNILHDNVPNGGELQNAVGYWMDLCCDLALEVLKVPPDTSCEYEPDDPRHFCHDFLIESWIDGCSSAEHFIATVSTVLAEYRNELDTSDKG